MNEIIALFLLLLVFILSLIVNFGLIPLFLLSAFLTFKANRKKNRKKMIKYGIFAVIIIILFIFRQDINNLFRPFAGMISF